MFLLSLVCLLLVVVLVIVVVFVLVILVILVVFVILTFHAVPPSYNNLGPFTFDTQEGAKDFKIDLPFSARPSPAFEWTLNNNVIQETANRMLTSSSIRLATVDRTDRGTYVVSANNSAGSDNATIVLNIICELGKREKMYIHDSHYPTYSSSLYSTHFRPTAVQC